MLIAQVGHRHGGKRIDSHRDKHHPHILRVVAVAHHGRQRTDEHAHHAGKHQRRGGNHAQRGGVNLSGIFAFLAHKAEEGGLHAVSKQYDEQRYVGVDVGDDAVLSSGSIELSRLYGHQQIVDEACQYAAQTVDGRVFGQ